MYASKKHIDFKLILEYMNLKEFVPVPELHHLEGG